MKNNNFLNTYKESDIEIKKGVKILFIGLFLEILSFIFILSVAILQNKLTKNLLFLLVIMALLCLIVGLIFCIKSYKRVLEFEVLRLENEYKGKELYKLNNVNKSDVEKVLYSNKFKKDGMYYKKKKFNLMRDSITYYFRLVDSKRINSCVNRESELFNEIEKNKTFCLCLFIYLDNIDVDSIDETKNLAKKFIVYENVLNPYIKENTVFVIVNKNNGEGYFLDIGKKHRLSIYNKGCKIIKKYFK